MRREMAPAARVQLCEVGSCESEMVLAIGVLAGATVVTLLAATASLPEGSLWTIEIEVAVTGAVIELRAMVPVGSPRKSAAPVLQSSRCSPPRQVCPSGSLWTIEIEVAVTGAVIELRAMVPVGSPRKSAAIIPFVNRTLTSGLPSRPVLRGPLVGRAYIMRWRKRMGRRAWQG